jgi:protein-L-isoaspartate(D-aspartate) O-methyltransferase
MEIEAWQHQLLEQSRFIYQDTPISDSTAQAFLATPRHLFVTRYRDWASARWHDVGAENLQEHLAALYENRPLILFGDDDDDVQSTISEPSFVLRMLDLLQPGPGQRILELGAGSGWNAALLACLVGPEGHVHSLEIIPEMAGRAAGALERLGIRNVDVIAGDGGDGYPDGAPYDRVIFTAGSYDLPRAFHEQLRDGGLLLMVLKNPGGGDTLFLLRKSGSCFVSMEAMPCGFVQLQGRHRTHRLDPRTVESLPEWEDLRSREISRAPFWWGGKGRAELMWRTLGIQSFLSIVEPAYLAFKAPKKTPRSREEHYFGLLLPEERSLVLARDDSLVGYGNAAARERLLERVRYWVDVGMPTAASLTLRTYPNDAAVAPGPDEWLVKRQESQFLWSLPPR